MDPRSYLTLARDLLSRVKSSQGLATNAGEAECRAAISRAYYSSFLVAVAFLDGIGLTVTDSGKCHITVQHSLNNCGEDELVAVSGQLGTLYVERRNADYEPGNPRPEDAGQVEAMIDLSSAAIATLDKWAGECRRDAQKGQSLSDTILAWAKQACQEGSIWRKRPPRRK